MVTMPSGCLPLEVFWACPTRRRPQTCWRDFYISPDLGTPWDSPGGADEYYWRDGCLGFIAQPNARPQISSRKWMDGWMDGPINHALIGAS